MLVPWIPVTLRFIPIFYVHPALLLVIRHVHTGKNPVSPISSSHSIGLHMFLTASVFAILAILYRGPLKLTNHRFGYFPPRILLRPQVTLLRTCRYALTSTLG